MDGPLAAIVDVVDKADYATIRPSAREALLGHLVDSVGCAAGGFDSEPARLAREIVRGTSAPVAASVAGVPSPVPVELAAFANTTMIRYLDYNDAGRGGHPSDMFGALLAVAEASGSSGKDLLTAVYVAYEVYECFTDAVSVRDRGWDQGVHCSLGAAAGLAKLLGLPPEQTANALSLAITPSIPLRVVRTGELSHWKGCATAHAMLTATFGVRLAQLGMTGPPAPFEGADGVFDQVTGPFAFDFGQPISAAERAHYKSYPSEFHSQVPIYLMTELREQVAPEDIASIEVVTFHLAWHEIGGGQGDAAQKWDPQTRETADHSMPWLMAVALRDGTVSPASFTSELIADADLRILMSRIQVRQDPALTVRHRQHREFPAEITVTLSDGSMRHLAATHAPGQGGTMSREQLNTKFDSMATTVLYAEQAHSLRDQLWGLEQASNLSGVAALLRAFRA